MASCSQETPWGSGTDSGEGGINVRLTALTDVKAAVPSVRAENGELVPPPRRRVSDKADQERRILYEIMVFFGGIC